MQIGAYAPYNVKAENRVGNFRKSAVAGEYAETERRASKAIQEFIDSLSSDENRIREKDAGLGGLSGTSDILQRMRDMSLKFGGDLADGESMVMQKEIGEMKKRLQALTDAARFYYYDAEKEMNATIFSSYKFDLYANIMNLTKERQKGKTDVFSIVA